MGVVKVIQQNILKKPRIAAGRVNYGNSSIGFLLTNIEFCHIH